MAVTARSLNRVIINPRLSRLPGFQLPLDGDALLKRAIVGGTGLTPAAVRSPTLAVSPVNNHKIIITIRPRCSLMRVSGELLTVYWLIHFKTTR